MRARRRVHLIPAIFLSVNFALIRENVIKRIRINIHGGAARASDGAAMATARRAREKLVPDVTTTTPTPPDGISGESRRPGYANATVSPAGLSTDVFSIRDSNKFNLVRSFVTYSPRSLSLSSPLPPSSTHPRFSELSPLTPLCTHVISLVSFLFLRRVCLLTEALSNPFAIVGYRKERSWLTFPSRTLY